MADMIRIPIVDKCEQYRLVCQVGTTMEYVTRVCNKTAMFSLGGHMRVCRRHAESLLRALAKALGYKLVKVDKGEAE